MKYLIWLFIVLAGVWWFRQQRRNSTPGDATPTSPGAQTMVPCAHCGVHLPEADAVRGQHGMYCSDAHRQRHEG